MAPLEAARTELQSLLDRAVRYEPAPPDDEAVAELHLLVTGRLARLLYSSVQDFQANDFEYGLDLLGDAVDDLTARNPGIFRVDDYRVNWWFSIPEHVVTLTLASLPNSDRFAVSLAEYLRLRIIRWIPSNIYSMPSNRYVHLFTRLLISTNRSNGPELLPFALKLRELPWFVAGQGSTVLVRAHRSSGLSFSYAIIDCVRNYRESQTNLGALLHYGWSLFTISPLERQEPNAHHRLAGEYGVGLLGALLYTLDTETQSESESIMASFDDSLDDIRHERWFEPAHLFSVLKDMDRVIHDWNWETWEVSQSDLERAQWLSMPTWCQRAAAILISRDAYQLFFTPGSELPSLGVLRALQNSIDTGHTDSNWRKLLTDAQQNRLGRLEQALSTALEQRERYQFQLISKAPLSPQKINDYLTRLGKAVEERTYDFRRWLSDCGCSVSGEEPEAPDHWAQFEITRGKEDFIDNDDLDDVGDQPLVHFDDQVGDFERYTLANTLHESAPEGAVTRATKDEIVEYIRLLGSLPEFAPNNLFCIVAGTWNFGIYDKLQELGFATQSTGPSTGYRLASVPALRDGSNALIVGLAYPSFRFTRFAPPNRLADSYSKTGLPSPLDDLRLEIAPFSEDDIQSLVTRNSQNAEGSEDASLRYRVLVRERITWRFTCTVLSEPQYRIFTEP